MTLDEACEAWLRESSLAKGSKEFPHQSYLEQCLRRIIGSCSDPVPMLIGFVRHVARESQI